MTFVRTFEGFSPPRRDDGVAFTLVKIYENTVATYSTATLIDTINLSPVDPDPSHPLTRNVTTANAVVAQNGWYWLVWEDPNGAQFISDPVQSGTSPLSIIETLVRSEMPMTWDGLEKDAYLGLSTLRIRIANVKSMILPTATAEQDEDSYSNVLRAYVSKRAALDLIPTGIEFWMRQKTSLSATGTNENKTLPDPIAALRDLAKRLAVEVENLAGNVDVVQATQITGEAPAISNDGDPITPDPYDWNDAFADDTSTGQVL